jgi:hypothetical protein
MGLRTGWEKDHWAANASKSASRARQGKVNEASGSAAASGSTSFISGSTGCGSWSGSSASSASSVMDAGISILVRFQGVNNDFT